MPAMLVLCLCIRWEKENGFLTNGKKIVNGNSRHNIFHKSHVSEITVICYKKLLGTYCSHKTVLSLGLQLKCNIFSLRYIHTNTYQHLM